MSLFEYIAFTTMVYTIFQISSSVMVRKKYMVAASHNEDMKTLSIAKFNT